MTPCWRSAPADTFGALWVIETARRAISKWVAKVGNSAEETGLLVAYFFLASAIKSREISMPAPDSRIMKGNCFL